MNIVSLDPLISKNDNYQEPVDIMICKCKYLTCKICSKSYFHNLYN